MGFDCRVLGILMSENTGLFEIENDYGGKVTIVEGKCPRGFSRYYRMWNLRKNETLDGERFRLYTRKWLPHLATVALPAMQITRVTCDLSNQYLDQMLDWINERGSRWAVSAQIEKPLTDEVWVRNGSDYPVPFCFAFSELVVAVEFQLYWGEIHGR